MATRKKTDDQLSHNLTDAGAELEIVPVGGEPEAEPMRETVLVYHLPNFAQDRRSDLRAARVKVGSIDDLTRFDELFRAHANVPGFYLQEHRIGGQVAAAKVVEVKARVETMGDTASAASVYAQPARETPSQVVRELTESVRALSELKSEVNPPAPAAPTLSPADIHKMITDAVRDALAQSQPAQPAAPAPKSLTEQLREMAESKTILQSLFGEPRSEAAKNDSPENFLDTYKRFREIGDELNPSREGRSKWEVAADVLKDVVSVGKDVVPLVVPMLSATRVGAMMQGAGMGDAAPPAEAQPQATQTQAQPAPAQSTEPQNENEALALIAHVAVHDLIKNKRVGRTADLIEEMAARFPAILPMIAQLCAATPEQALSLLSQFTGRNDLHSYNHWHDWIVDLIDELKPEDDGDGDDPIQGAADAPSLVQMASERAS